MIEQLFRGLLRIDHDLNVVPELAQNMNVSADGLTYLFMLREDACWSDGHPLTAGDFVYAWRKLREEGHVTAFLLDDIASAEALDDWTLEVHLREPRNYFPYVLASHWAYPWPRHRADEVGAAWRRPESLVGNGPFVLAEVDETGARLSANPHWRTASGNVGEVRIDVPRAQRASRRSTSGSRAATTCSSCATRRSAAADTIAERSPTLSTTFLGFNVGTQPMADERVRRALAHAIDRAALLADSPGRRPGRRPRRRDPARDAGPRRRRGPRRTTSSARAQLLAEAGYPGRRGPAGARRGRAAVVARRGARRAARRDRRARRASRRTASTSASRTRRTSGSRAGTPTTPTRTASTSGCCELGLPLYRDEETDAVLARARASRDRDERLRLYREFERIWIGQRAALVPLSYARQLVLRRPHVHGLRLNPMGAFHLEQVVVDPLRDAPTRSVADRERERRGWRRFPCTSAAWTSRW